MLLYKKRPAFQFKFSNPDKSWPASKVMHHLHEHLKQQRLSGPDVVLGDTSLAFADVDPLSSDSELSDLYDPTEADVKSADM